MTDVEHNSIGHEPDTTDVRGVGVTGVAILAGIAVILAVVYGMFQYLAHHPVIVSPGSPLAETSQQQFPPPPRIEVQPAKELRDLRSYEEHILSTYGWVDKNAGIVRIPISRAMELQLERGFPVRKQVPK
jgi:hypothetical protein